MNEAVNQHIGGTKRRNKGDALDNDDAGLKASMGKKLPKEAVAFAKAMGISMDGIEAEAEDMCIDPTSAASVTRVLAYSAYTSDCTST